jgi:hypothetical protein
MTGDAGTVQRSPRVADHAADRGRARAGGGARPAPDELRLGEDKILEHETDLDRRRRELEFAWSKKQAELDEREGSVAERERPLTEKAKTLEETARKKARSLADETVSLAELNREIAWREKAVKVVLPDPAELEDTQEMSSRPSRPRAAGT